MRVAACHGHQKGVLRALLARADLLLHGHTHQRRVERIGGALVVNPGALQRAATRTLAIVHLPALEVAFFEVTADGVAPCAPP